MKTEILSTGCFSANPGRNSTHALQKVTVAVMSWHQDASTLFRSSYQSKVFAYLNDVADSYNNTVRVEESGRRYPYISVCYRPS